MLFFALRRLAAGVVLLIVISFLAFVLLFASGGDIVRRIMGENAPAELVAKRTTELGLDRPVLVQYGDWLMHTLSGDLGRSWFRGDLVAVSLTSRFAVTLSIIALATVIATVLAVVLGILAARAGGWIDATVQFLTVIAMAIPNYLVALILVVVFALNLHWFRATGYTPFAESPSGWIISVTLPVIALAVGSIAAVAQQIRGSVLDSLSRDYVRTLRARGLSMNRVTYKHVLRNSAGPALAVLGLQFIGMLGGIVIIEQVFALPGIGQLAVQSTVDGDIPVVMGVVMATAVIVVVVNLIVDIAQAALNPKVRLA